MDGLDLHMYYMYGTFNVDLHVVDLPTDLSHYFKRFKIYLHVGIPTCSGTTTPPPPDHQRPTTTTTTTSSSSSLSFTHTLLHVVDLHVDLHILPPLTPWMDAAITALAKPIFIDGVELEGDFFSYYDNLIDERDDLCYSLIFVLLMRVRLNLFYLD